MSYKRYKRIDGEFFFVNKIIKCSRGIRSYSLSFIHRFTCETVKRPLTNKYSTIQTCEKVFELWRTEKIVILVKNLVN